MKNYLDKIKDYSKILTKCAKWHNSNSSLYGSSGKSEKDKDYIYELFCYFVILKDLLHNYDLEYYEGIDPKEHVFPKSPAKKEGYPFFYIVDKATKQKLFQVCAGTMIEALTFNHRAPDISFQNHDTSLSHPTYKETKMIFDAKRKRHQSSSQKISLNQYAYFSNMIVELKQQSALLTGLIFRDFKEFNGNCLITNKSAYCSDIARNNLHSLKEVEFLDDKIDLSKLKVIG